MRQHHRREAYWRYTGDMLYLCARSLGQEVERPFSEIMDELDQPISSRRQHETTLAQAQACWEKALADSQKAAEQDGGEEP